MELDSDYNVCDPDFKQLRVGLVTHSYHDSCPLA